MNVKQMKTEELIPYENNPRFNEDAVDKVAESIREFGFKVPIIIDSNNVIVTGHTRLIAANKLGMEQVPVIVANDLSDSQIKAFRIADNRVAEFSEWDFDKLEMELEELADISFDMDELGFDEEKDEELTEEDELDDISDVEVIIIEPENHSDLELQFNKLKKEGYNCRISTL